MVKMDKKKNFVFMIVLCAFLVSLGTFAEAASNYPNKNISVVVPTAEGGAADRVIRAVTTV